MPEGIIAGSGAENKGKTLLLPGWAFAGMQAFFRVTEVHSDARSASSTIASFTHLGWPLNRASQED